MIKNVVKRSLSILITILMLAAIMPSLSIPAWAAGNASGNANVTSSNANTLDITVTATPSESSGCTGTSYSASDATVTVKNATGSQAIISFEYEMTGVSFKIGGNSTTSAKGQYASVMGNGAEVVFVATNAGTQGTSSSVRVYNFSVVQDVERTLTFNAATGGSITVGGVSVTTSTTVTANFSTGVAVTATANSGYTFVGWIDDNHTNLSSEASTTIKPTADATITPLFVANSSTQTYWGVGSKIFDGLEEAISEASSGSTKKVVLLRNGTLAAGNYTVPSGVTVLIPFDDAGTVVKETPEVVYNAYSTPTAFRTLTMPGDASITVENGGAICLGGKLSSKGQLGGYNGTPTGPDGRIKMMSGSSITLESGSNLYCWGYIYGSGEVEALSGASVH